MRNSTSYQIKRHTVFEQLVLLQHLLPIISTSCQKKVTKLILQKFAPIKKTDVNIKNETKERNPDEISATFLNM